MTAIPLKGDRGAWDNLGYPELHASDLYSGSYVNHAPAPDRTDIVVYSWDGIHWSVISASALTQIKITLFSGGVSIGRYESTQTGLDEAIAASGDGDVIFLPNVDITGNFSIPYGVGLVGLSDTHSIIRGEVIIGSKCLLENFTIIDEQDTSASICTLSFEETIGSGESSKINNCIIKTTNNGSGDVRSIIIHNGDLLLWNSTLETYSQDTASSLCVYEEGLDETGALHSSNTYYTALNSGSGIGHAFSNKGLADWYITGGKIIATTSPVEEV
jgi:hypothetical protein